MESDRICAVTSKLSDYVRSPSLRHIRDPHSLQKLARDILDAVDRAGSVWSKWVGAREDLAKAAANCWIPTDDLLAFLNGLPGPILTNTDVKQRLRAIWEEPWTAYPKDEFKAGCLALYEAEKARGTELPAIIGALQEYIEIEEERLRQEQQKAYQRHRDDERIRLQQRFMSGADCGWTLVGESKDFYCRRNGRAFRIALAKDKRWKLYRISMLDDPGDLLGIYLGRRDANKALESIAYQAEPARRE
jgi:hypothetical protein